MTVTLNDITSRQTFVATASQTVFNLNFRFFSDADLVVYKNGVLLALTTDYTVAGANALTGMAITLVVPAALDDQILVFRNIPIDRLAQYSETGPFPMASLNSFLTRLVAMIQQVRDDLESPDSNGNVYSGTVDPTVWPDGDALQAGDLYYNTAMGVMRIYTGTAWVNLAGTPNSSFRTYNETAASAKTTFTITGGYTPGLILVFLNGVLLEPAEYTAANGTTVVLGSTCAISDEFRAIVFLDFTVANAVLKTGDTMTGNLTAPVVNATTLNATTLSAPSIIGTTLNGGPFGGNRNRLINSRFDVAQRGLSGTITAAGDYMVDRWFGVATGANLTWSRITGGFIVDDYFLTALQITGAASNTFARVHQRVSWVDAYDLRGKTITFSAYVIQVTGGSRDFVLSVANPTVQENWTSKTAIANSGPIAVANNTWTRITWTTTLPASGPDLGLEFSIDLNGSLLAGQTMAMTGVQVEVGSRATPVEVRLRTLELFMCRRFYQTSYNLGVVPGVVPVTDLINQTHVTASGGFTYSFGLSMRVAPTVVIYDANGNANRVSYFNGSWQVNGTITTQPATQNFVYVQANIASATQLAFAYTASAEL